jgi:hypothetical protein
MLTLQENTERPITVTPPGGSRPQPLAARSRSNSRRGIKRPLSIPLLDGHATERIAHVVSATLRSQADQFLVAVSG